MKLPKISLFQIVSLLCLCLLVSSMTGQAQSRSSYSVQLASVTSEEEAIALIAELKAKGVEAYWVKSEVPGKGTRFRVRVGKFNSLPGAKAAGEKLIASGAATEFAPMVYEPPSTPVIARHESKKPEKSEPKEELKDKPKDKPKNEKVVEQPAKTAEPEKPQPKVARNVTKSLELKIASTAVNPAKAIIQQSKPAVSEPPTVSTSTETTTSKDIAENKESPKPELKPEPVPKQETEAKPVEAKPDSTTVPIPAPKDVTTQVAPPIEPTVVPTVEPIEKTAPKLLTPRVGDTLLEAVFSKSNWQIARRATESDKNLRTVHFVDSMTGWAAGDAGAIYRTTDGGKNWKPLLSGVNANINFIFFLDWNHGWMIGDSTNKDDDGETLLLSTINGGRTWMIQKLPNLLSVHFTDLQNGWAVGRNATLLHTTNGGVDWKPAEEIKSLIGLPVESSNYNFGFRDVYFTDPEHGWLVGNFYGRAQNNIGGLFATTDGGKTWQRVPLTLETKYVSGRFTPGTINSVHFSDESTGTVTGEMKDGENRFFFALHTRDGGKTWNQNRTSIQSTLSTQFLDPVNGWMAAFAPREGSAEAVVYDTSLLKTDNGGQSWQTDFTAKGSRIRNLFFLSPNKGWAVGDRGMILRYEEKTKAMN